MATVLLLRHGLTAMTGPVLAGRTPGVHLDDRGIAQAASVAQRLASVALSAVVTSPLERCAETAKAVTKAQRSAGHAPSTKTDRRLVECDYGDWTGQKITALAKEPLWRVVQAQPSAATFPNGESMGAMAARGVAAVRSMDATLSAQHGAETVWVACSHGDVIKAILADALGLHLDLFQRIVVDPCSISAIRYTDGRPFVLTQNDTGGDLARLVPPKPAKTARGRQSRSAASDATIGGGAGAGTV
ncbi:MSMEG_4193 family putative phosphomutase [Jatrophihabitans telluris]|uniref:MSMEG_4193 family putative phosphomutase n=1 Tax=Jatrophihabitans telluris TaxID=2038343 RepID=A0ABY4QSM6_9ACTN|nr:histidine phosphatase family protein [Jatrophihabitans telluris]UQX86635.1 MSMEG_4193 family putative phosphomutase [Jatrophihabitans telluris]